MKNKTMKALGVLGLSLLVGAGMFRSVYAVPGEAAITDGSFGLSEIASVLVATGTAGAAGTSFEVRRIRTAADGKQLVWQGVSQSSFSNITSSTQTCVVNGQVYDSTTTSCQTANRNVFDVGSSSEPIFLSKIVAGNLTEERVRVFDTRGSTDPAFSKCLFDRVITSTNGSGVIPDFSMFLSSGLAVFKSGTGSIFTYWSPTKRQ